MSSKNAARDIRPFETECPKCGTKISFTLTEGAEGVSCPACPEGKNLRLDLPPLSELIKAAVSAARAMLDGSPEAMLQLLKEVLALDDWNAEAHNLLGTVHDNAKRSSDAVRHFQRAVWIEPERSIYWYDLGVALCYQNDYRSARTAFESALEILPEYLHAMSNLMTCYFNLHHLPAAVVVADRVATLDLQGPLGNHCRTIINKIAGNLDDRSSAQEYGTAVILRVFDLQKRKQWDEAAHILEDCLPIVPTEDPFCALVQEYLAGCYLVLERFSEAFEHSRQAKTLLPCVTALVEQPRLLLMEAGDLKDIEELYKSVVRKLFGLENGAYLMKMTAREAREHTSYLQYGETSVSITRAGNVLRISKDGQPPVEQVLYEDSYVQGNY